MGSAVRAERKPLLEAGTPRAEEVRESMDRWSNTVRSILRAVDPVLLRLHDENREP